MEKTSVRVSQYTIKKTTITSQYKILQSISLSAKQHILLFTVIKNHNRIHTSLFTVIKIHNKHKHNHTIKITARYVGCMFHDGMLKARRSWATYTRGHWRG